MMRHKGYVGKVTDFDDGFFHGRIVNIRDVVTFEGTTAAEVETSFRDSVEDYLAMCEEEGAEPLRPFSGKYLLRLDPDLHRRLHLASQLKEKSINALVVEAIESELERSEL